MSHLPSIETEAAGRNRFPAARSRRWDDAPVTDIIDDLTWRGLIALSTDLDDLRKALDAGPVTFYCGFDPTAPGLHIGNLVQLLTMRRLAAGRAPADRPGRRRDRTDRRSRAASPPSASLNPREVVAEWVERHPGGGQPVPGLRPWPGRRHCGQQPGLDRPAVRARLPARHRQALPGQPDAGPGVGEAPGWRPAGSATPSSATRSCRPTTTWSCTDRHGCTLQLGGSDQWGNLVAGRRPDPAGDGRLRACAGHPADHQAGRDQVRQDRGRHDLAEART